MAIVRQEKYMLLCRDYFKKEGHEAYIASKKEEKTYANRTKRTVEHVVIYGFVFVKALPKEINRLWKGCSFIRTFLYNRSMKVNERTGRPPFAIIPDDQMARLQRAIDNTEYGDVTFTEERLQSLKSIRIIQGKLKGFEGEYYSRGGEDFIILRLENLGNAKVKVSMNDCIFIEN